ncbi:MAG: hypothetical protein V1866_05815 [archaeon]
MAMKMHESRRMGKKGLLYLLVSSLFVMVMIVVFLAYRQYSFTDRQKVLETRIMTINDFIKDMEFDSKRVIYIAGFRSLIALEDHVARTGLYLNDTEELFRLAFYNGTVNGTSAEVLANSTYMDYLQKLRLIAEKIGIDVDINVTNITLYHDSPWSVNVIVTTHVNITDQKGVARWEFDKNYFTSVSLINIRDPVYSVSTYGRVPSAIRPTNISDFVVGNSTAPLLAHINNSFYINSSLAPSFLMRMEGNLSSSPFGIESIVDVDELQVQGFVIGIDFSNSRSFVDYIFFSNITGYSAQRCSVQNMPAMFRIDANHTGVYDVEGLAYTNCTG